MGAHPVDIAAKRAEHRRLKEQGLALTDKAVAEDRQLTPQEADQLKELIGQAKGIQRELEGVKVGASPELMKQLEDLGRRPDMWPHLPEGGGMKVGQGATLQVKAAEASHPWALAIEQTSRARGEKAFAAPTGSIPLPALSTVPVSMGMLGAPLVQAIGLRPWPADGGRAVTYLRQTGRVNRAAIWHSGAAPDGSDTPSKPITDLTTVAVVANAEVIAHLASPVKRNDLADFPGMQQWVSSELTYGLTQALEAAILTAAGPEPAMTGLLHLAGTTTVAAAADVAGTIEAAAVALQLLGYGDGLQAAMNPTDWSAVATAKGADGHPVYPTLPTGPATPSIYGVGIVPSPNVPAGTAVVANFRSAVAVYERETPIVEWGTLNDQFAKNLLSARCEGRFALTVPQPAAIAIADLTP
jgi:hypothetical protein